VADGGAARSGLVDVDGNEPERAGGPGPVLQLLDLPAAQASGPGHAEAADGPPGP